MIRRAGTVVEVTHDSATIAVDPQAGCARCEAGAGCGQGLLFRWFTADRPVRLPVDRQAAVAVGQRVHVGLAPTALLRCSLALYGAPLAGLLAGLAAGQLSAGDPGAAAGGLAGLAAGLLAARRIAAGTSRLWRADA
ncbi:MAG: SoxR reducing system RseC family protein [Pseudomonadota bacterium]